MTKDGMRIRHCELVETIDGSVAFEVISLNVNPGRETVFPWLSKIASRYQQYKVHRLSFESVTRTSTATKGSVLMAPEYENMAGDPDTEATMSTYHGCVEDVAWNDIWCNIDTKAIHATNPRKLIRDQHICGNRNVYDACRFYHATTGFANADAIAKLWVHYDIEFFIPQTETQLLTYDFAARGLVADEPLTSAVPHQIAYDAEYINELGVDPIPGFPTQFTVPKGLFRITVSSTVEFAAVTDWAIQHSFIVGSGFAIGPTQKFQSGRIAAGALLTYTMESTFTMQSLGSGVFTISIVADGTPGAILLKGGSLLGSSVSVHCI